MHFASYNTEISFPTSYHFKPGLFANERDSNSIRSSPQPSTRQRLFDEVDLGDSGYKSVSQTPTQNRRVTSNSKPEVDSTVLVGHGGHDCREFGCERVVINVSGLKFETQLKTLNRLPHTLLGDPAKRKKYWDPRRKEYFLDRHRPTFQAILYFYQSGGRLKRPMEVPPDVFLSELDFYEFGGTVIESFQRNEGHLIEKSVLLPQDKVMRKLWQTFENPSSSIMAKVVMTISVLFILVSVVGFCMETLPQFRNSACLAHLSNSSKEAELTGSAYPEHTVSFCNNVTRNRIEQVDATSRNPKSIRTETSGAEMNDGDDFLTRPNYQGTFFIIEAVCVSWFTLEFFLRLISCPSKKEFLKGVINLIDLAAIIPFYVTLVMNLVTDQCVDTSKTGIIMGLRVVRVARVFKLGKHSVGLQILAKTLRASVRELSMFAMFLIIAILVFSCLMYQAEHGNNPTRFTSIPDSFWYSTVTMTTVGYGDVYPIGIMGKIVGVLCVLSGVLVIALPVPVIVANFSNYYSHATGRGITYT